MNNINIVITENDYDRLKQLIESKRRSSRQDQEHINALEQELDRATVIGSDEIPRDVVTINSRVRVHDLDKGREVVYQIVFPGSADAARNRISVLAPLGTGLLGYRAGNTIEWPVPSGVRHLRVLAIEPGPESEKAAA